MLWSIAALAGAVIGTIPLSAQAQQCANGRCNHPVVSTSTIYKYRTVPKISDVNRYRDVTHTSYHDITKTQYHDVNKVAYKDITNTRYVRHINRIVNVTRVQPIVNVHTVTRVHNEVVARVHTQVVPRVHVSVVPRYHTQTVMLHQNEYASQTQMLPTRTAMAGSSTVMAGTRYAQVNAGSHLVDWVPSGKHRVWRSY
jgi:hypothetical protein